MKIKIVATPLIHNDSNISILWVPPAKFEQAKKTLETFGIEVTKDEPKMVPPSPPTGFEKPSKAQK